MLIIEPTSITLKDNLCYLETPFSLNGEAKVLWYSFSFNFKEHLIVNQADAAVVGLLSLAFKNDVDVVVHSPLSAKLHYSLNNYVIPALAIAHNTERHIKIEAKQLTSESLNLSKKKATGVSCGIDSLTTIATHDDLDHLFYLNAGSHGDFGGERATRVFEMRQNNAEKFADKIELPLTSVNSNLSELLHSNFQSLHSLRQLSCILNLQKLLNTYYYASAYRLDYFKLDKKDTSSWDTLLVKMLETESMTFYNSSSQFTRFEKTKIVGNYKPAFQHLDVCTNPINETDFINCSSCDKCLRTLISLEVVGAVDNFSNVFDLKIYESSKFQYLLKLYNRRNNDPIHRDLFGQTERLRKQIPLHSKFKFYKRKFIKRLKGK